MASNFNIFKCRVAFYLVCVAVFIGLFLLDEDMVTSRLGKELWNLLHLCAFFIVWLFLINLFVTFQPKRPVVIVKILVITLVASVCIEVIQYYTGRDASVGDIGLNLAGTLLALLVSIRIGRYFENRSGIIILLIILATGILLWPSSKIFIDEVTRRQQFPMLADFSGPFELGRWSGHHATLNITKATSGNVMNVTLLPGSKYSTVSLNTEHEDWTRYRELVIEVINSGKSDLSLVLRVHDALHNNDYSDRFNRKFDLPVGPSSITVDLLDLYNAPRGRKMDLNRIEVVSLFATDLKSSRQFQIKKIYLH